MREDAGEDEQARGVVEERFVCVGARIAPGQRVGRLPEPFLARGTLSQIFARRTYTTSVLGRRMASSSLRNPREVGVGDGGDGRRNAGRQVGGVEEEEGVGKGRERRRERRKFEPEATI